MSTGTQRSVYWNMVLQYYVMVVRSGVLVLRTLAPGPGCVRLIDFRLENVVRGELSLNKKKYNAPLTFCTFSFNSQHTSTFPLQVARLPNHVSLVELDCLYGS
jgi:hypothetical protein